MKIYSVVPIYMFYLIFCGIVVSCNTSSKEQLPIYNPIDFNPLLVDSSMHSQRKNHMVSDFSLINQYGDTITQHDYQNKIYVTDFIFTRCPSICPIMTNHIQRLQKVFNNDEEVAFLSISVTPKMDSVPILKEYADRNNAIRNKWNITTGDKKHIYNLARKSYFAAVDEGDGGLQDFIHTPNFILVDTKKQIRGVYDGTKTSEVDRLIKDINILRTNF
ncbi:SCO family protein [Sediminicola luteus]|uniref:SCO family protein n=1 Tax=Sediminicola luteus TaxID=319238 RepID=A0ABV2TXZ2_9FLAO